MPPRNCALALGALLLACSNSPSVKAKGVQRPVDPTHLAFQEEFKRKSLDIAKAVQEQHGIAAGANNEKLGGTFAPTTFVAPPPDVVSKMLDQFGAKGLKPVTQWAAIAGPAAGGGGARGGGPRDATATVTADTSEHVAAQGNRGHKAPQPENKEGPSADDKNKENKKSKGEEEEQKGEPIDGDSEAGFKHFGIAALVMVIIAILLSVATAVVTGKVDVIEGVAFIKGRIFHSEGESMVEQLKKKKTVPKLNSTMMMYGHVSAKPAKSKDSAV